LGESKRRRGIIGGESADAGGEHALGSVVAFEFDFFAVAESSEASAFDDAEMDEDVGSLSVDDESEAFFSIEPFDFANRHVRTSVWTNTREAC
jgi:hypothetical protein